jgi:hypothetical protein
MWSRSDAEGLPSKLLRRCGSLKFLRPEVSPKTLPGSFCARVVLFYGQDVSFCSQPWVFRAGFRRSGAKTRAFVQFRNEFCYSVDQDSGWTTFAMMNATSELWVRRLSRSSFF